jgi:hypothetical protein
MDVISSSDQFYRYLKQTNTKLLANIIFAGSPGHQIAELDYFLRKYRCGDVPREGRYLWIQGTGHIASTLADVYGEHFRQFGVGMLAHDHYFAMASEIHRMVPELGIDVGLSHLKNAVHSHANTFVSKLGDKLYYYVTNDAVVQATRDYHRTRSLTEDFFPWNGACPRIEGPLADLLGGQVDRVAVIHFRTRPGNAGITVPAENFSLSFEYLRDNGFTLVKVGTEPYPEEFSRYGVINYSESGLWSFRNDLALLGNAKLNIINASGLEHIADVMGGPIVSYGRWHLTLAPYSSKMVVVPALLFDPGRQRFLTFGEQMLFFRTRHELWEGNAFGWHVPIDRFTPRVPQADELCAAVQEALALSHADVPLTPEQRSFNQLDENGLLSVGRSRISQFFLERCRSHL